ncbi:hypothetical protein AVEN_194900-1 [Araneus ventricosus]|uniref:Uncharacterized protein n=1 Tax=Araneus ventricosus TaxID=182803 RepID=A0A4Y2B3U3_ARAVE|nr:hypothetical protein AVEN_194900-1 [Araneus ventricosus]
MKSREWFKINRIRIEWNDVLAKSIFYSQSLTGPVVTASASEPASREFYPLLCSYSVFAIICNASLLQVRPMVTSRLALSCCKLVSHLHTCPDKFAESLQTYSANLLQTKIAICERISEIKIYKNINLVETMLTEDRTHINRFVTQRSPDQAAYALDLSGTVNHKINEAPVPIRFSIQTVIRKDLHDEFEKNK